MKQLKDIALWLVLAAVMAVLAYVALYSGISAFAKVERLL